ncbi:unnamed protein product [Sphagnum jensenii]|uniref:Peptidase A1 domain-containing protein n=1 Tax=Sphagnum jensenii TaxID=128206 RepID=A0ABP1A8R9_9BRYO
MMPFSSRSDCSNCRAAGGVWAMILSRRKWTIAGMTIGMCLFLYFVSVVLIPHEYHRDAALPESAAEKFDCWWRWWSTRTTSAAWQVNHVEEVRRDHGSSSSAVYKSNVGNIQQQQRFFSGGGGRGNTSGPGAGAAIRMKLVHRNSPESPFRKVYTTPGKALEDAMEMDALRLAGFRKRMLAEAYDWNLLTAATDEQLEGPAAGPVAISTPATVASIENPNGKQIPPTELDFYTPVVSGSTLGSGQYFVSFSIGTPAQNFSLVADTGSDLVWVQCAPCEECYTQEGPLYSPSNSSSFVPVSCSSNECNLIPATLGFPCDTSYSPAACAYVYQYADSSSTKGVFAYETATMKKFSSSSSSSGSTVHIENLAFGCGTDNQGSFQGAAGVMGLGQGPLSFTSQIGYAYDNKFSYCLVNFLDPVSVSSSLIFGDDSVLFAKHKLHYTPILSNPRSTTLYYVGIRELVVAGSSLQIPSSAWSFNVLGGGGTTLDSGTTLTYFVPAAYNVILQAFQQALQQFPKVTTAGKNATFDLCFNSSAAAADDHHRPHKYPGFRIRLENHTEFKPGYENYLVEVAPDVKCLAILQSNSGFNTIGNLLQQNFLVVYDRHNSRIGFARSKCGATEL